MCKASTVTIALAVTPLPRSYFSTWQNKPSVRPSWSRSRNVSLLLNDVRLRTCSRYGSPLFARVFPFLKIHGVPLVVEEDRRSDAFLGIDEHLEMRVRRAAAVPARVY